MGVHTHRLYIPDEVAPGFVFPHPGRNCTMRPILGMFWSRSIPVMQIAGVDPKILVTELTPINIARRFPDRKSMQQKSLYLSAHGIFPD